MNYSLRRDALHLRPLRQKRGSCGTCSEVPFHRRNQSAA
jgi:hypothetical protein